MRITFVFILVLIFSSCADSSLKDSRKFTESQINAIENIQKLEGYAKELSLNSVNDVEKLKAKLQLIDSLLSYYRSYPKDTLAAVCLDKAHMLYSGMEDYRIAVRYADMVIDQYPNYVNRRMVLESQITNYDIFIKPRNQKKIKKYIELMLNENDITEEQREQYEVRLRKNEKSFLD